MFADLRSGDLDWLEFWASAKSERWGQRLDSSALCDGHDHSLRERAAPRNHPAQDLPVDQQARTMAATFHGDEGESKKKKPLLVLSWSGDRGIVRVCVCVRLPQCCNYHDMQSRTPSH